ncbi:MAG: CarD family transcriptional regulator [Christensenellales bacterium]
MKKIFKIGDLIVYGGTGVCRVTDISVCDISGKYEDQLFYTFRPLCQDCIISIPVNTTKVFMRPIISKDEANRLIDMIPTIQAEAYHNPISNELIKHYETLLNTHDCMELIELVMSLYAKKQYMKENNRKFGAVDSRFMKRAEESLFGEFAAALEIPKESVPAYIAERIGEETGLDLNESVK